MATHLRSRDTAASPQAVWRLWSDPGTWYEWNPNVARMDLNGPFANGTTGVMHTRDNRAHQIQFANIQDGRSFDLETDVLPLTHFTFHCEVVPRTGGSTISQGIVMSGPLSFVFSPLAGDRIAATFEPLLKGLADRAEAAPTPAASNPITPE